MRTLVKPAQYVALCLYIVFLGFPLLWLISASLKSSAELNSLSVNLIPQRLALGATSPRPSIVRDWCARRETPSSSPLVSTALVILMALPAAYVLARFKGIVPHDRDRLDPGQPGLPGRS